MSRRRRRRRHNGALSRLILPSFYGRSVAVGGGASNGSADPDAMVPRAGTEKGRKNRPISVEISFVIVREMSD